MAKFAKLRMAGPGAQPKPKRTAATAAAAAAYRLERAARAEGDLEARWWLGLALAAHPDHTGAAKTAVSLCERLRVPGRDSGPRADDLGAWSDDLKRRLRCSAVDCSSTAPPAGEEAIHGEGMDRQIDPDRQKFQCFQMGFSYGIITGVVAGLAISGIASSCFRHFRREARG